MAEINPNQTNKKKGSFSKSSNRRSTRVDLTPMVDLGFLLITFFVFTTSMSLPKTMNLIETKDGEAKPVKESGAMTIILGANHQIYYYFGILYEKFPPPILKTDFKAIRSLILNKRKQTKIDDLMYIIKADKISTFGDNINLLDEMSICNVPSGHYAEVDISGLETTLIKSKN